MDSVHYRHFFDERGAMQRICACSYKKEARLKLMRRNIFSNSQFTWLRLGRNRITQSLNGSDQKFWIILRLNINQGMLCLQRLSSFLRILDLKLKFRHTHSITKSLPLTRRSNVIIHEELDERGVDTA